MFLSLPTELRFEIYAYIGVPHDAPLSAYAGLYLSCREIKAEIDSEGTRLLKAHLTKVTAEVKGLRIEFLSTMTLSAMQHVHLVICDKVNNLYLRTLLPVFTLHLPSITVTYQRENGSPVWNPKNINLIIHIILHLGLKYSALVPMLDRGRAMNWLGYGDKRGFRWRAKSGGGVEGVWEKECDLKERDENLERRRVLREIGLATTRLGTRVMA